MRTPGVVPLNYGTADALQLDVAVVGGGVAGLYAAWRLAKSNRRGVDGEPLRVAVIEATDRIGGRIETVTFPGMPEHRAEFGAMRLASWQKLVLTLADTLGIRVEPFLMGDEHNFWFLRGKRIHAAEFSDPTKVPYGLEGWEVGKTPQELLNHVAEAVLGDVPMPTDRRGWDDLKRTLRYRGRPAREFGFWNVLADQLSSEGVNFVSDAVGFGSMTQNWNALEALQLIYSDFGPEVSYVRFAGGTDELPVRLAHEAAAGGVEIFAGNALTRIDPAPAGGPAVLVTIQNRRSGQRWQVQARHLVCALPRRALELLGQPDSLFEPHPLADAEVLELVGSVHRYPAFKLFLAYEAPWWRELNISSGPAVTDLPIRQTYYFGVEESQRALLMSSYNDDRAVAYWQGLAWTEQDEPTAPRLQVAGRGGPSEVLVAPPEMVRHAQVQLSRMHGFEIPTPYLAAYRNWGRAPFGGAWHLWRVNADSVSVGRRMRRPLPEYNVHVCGEAYSGIQAFIEGALTSTELVLQEQLGLDPPEWLSDDYYLGARSSSSAM
ncbi:MAG TPA: NAD(P)/FAD-dependent oxidoreductase [Candidatus Limnocylindrales bacterium]|nr:NAD(P)/FAD-dependent oxidoreductase [Candidatus Limnocylindrales bacterium]